MRQVGEILEEIIDEYVAERDRHDAFVQALRELFRCHPIPDYFHETHHVAREAALRRAHQGYYYDAAPGGNQRWSQSLRLNARSWRVPPDQLVAIHALLYG